MTPSLQRAKTQIRQLVNQKKADGLLKFFKTEKGGYGEGDQFLGISVPSLRNVVKNFKNKLNKQDAIRFLKSDFHEERLFALFLLVELFKKGNEQNRKEIYEDYLTHTSFINNWDLVDSSAHFIVGAYLEHKNKKKLYQLAKSKTIWERRIAIISTLFYIRKNEFGDTLKISEMLLEDNHDLIHKAVGWMLREIGKRNVKTEKLFLDQYAHQMPRTMLRYAIEKFPQKERKRYLEIKKMTNS